MSGTVRTYGYLASSEFQDGQASGSITPADVRDLIATLQSAAQNAVTPQMYGAKGDGSTDDTTALNNCAVAACSNGWPIFLPAGTYMVSGGGWIITSNSGGTAKNSPGVVRGLGSRTVIKALAGCTKVVTMQNTSDTTLENFNIDCSSVAATGLDTSWNVNQAPSLNNIYKRIKIYDYTSIGWIADWNNDTNFDHCVMNTVANPGCVGLRLNANGGEVTINECVIFNSTIDFYAQNLNIVDCVTTGVRCTGMTEDNKLSYYGGYHYTANTSSLNIEVLSGFKVESIGCFGARFENPNSTSGFILGGAGTLTDGATFYSCKFLNTAGSGGPSIISSTLSHGAGNYLGRVDIINGVIDNAWGVASTADFMVNVWGAINMFTNAEWAPNLRVGRLSYTDVLTTGIQSYAAGWGKSGTVQTWTVGASSGSPATITNIPRIGLCMISATNGITPNTQFRYSFTTKDTAFSNPNGANTVAGAVVAGTGSQYNLTVTPSSATNTEYTVTIFGQQPV